MVTREVGPWPALGGRQARPPGHSRLDSARAPALPFGGDLRPPGSALTRPEAGRFGLRLEPPRPRSASTPPAWARPLLFLLFLASEGQPRPPPGPAPAARPPVLGPGQATARPPAPTWLPVGRFGSPGPEKSSSVRRPPAGRWRGPRFRAALAKPANQRSASPAPAGANGGFAASLPIFGHRPGQSPAPAGGIPDGRARPGSPRRMVPAPAPRLGAGYRLGGAMVHAFVLIDDHAGPGSPTWPSRLAEVEGGRRGLLRPPVHRRHRRGWYGCAPARPAG